ncbi:hypothetical protein H4S14_002225 [Agrobacterium vitis]|nr:hypothetical protein [Agrobacterium vitis]MBE1438478.1 hypothetical protein [Agrobacterium vitis]
MLAHETCEALKAELAQTPIVISNVQDVSLYSGAVTRQNFEIRKTLQNMQRLGCSSSVSVLDTSGHDICQDMQTSLNAMQANKQQLAQQRQAASQQGGANPRRQELLAALQTHGCADVQEPPLPASTDAPRPYQAPVYPDYSGPPAASTALRGQFMLPSGQGGYRTLCVRTCDGGFFPISPSTQPANFDRDAAQCQRMCPDTQTELYYSRLSQEAEDMVSTVTGQPYRDMPNAFAYRTRPPGQPGQCGCGIATAPPQQSMPVKDETSSVINVKTTPAATPDTAQTSSASEHHQNQKVEQTRIFDGSSSTIRQVGPVFFPTDSKAIDLRHPALEGPQPVQ